MIGNWDTRLLRYFKLYALIVSLFTIAASLVLLLGWIYRIDILRSWIPGSPRVRVMGAICMFTVGLSTWMQINPVDSGFSRWKRNAARGLALLVLVAGVISLWEHLTGRSSGIAEFFGRLNPGADYPAPPHGIFSFLVSIDRIMLGAALLGLDWRTRRQDWPAQIPATVSAIATAIVLPCYFRAGLPPFDIPFPSALLCTMMLTGVIASRAEWAFQGLLVSSTEGGVWMRRALAPSFAFLLLVAWVLVKPISTTETLGWTEAGVLATTTGLMITALIYSGARLLLQIESQRDRVQAALHLPAEHLQRLLDQYDESADDARALTWSKIGIALGICLTCSGFFFAWRTLHQSADDEKWVVHTHVVSTALETAQNHLTQIETSDRGFALTGDTNFLQSIAQEKASLPSDLQQISSLLSDNRMQLLLLRQLNPQIQQKLEIVDDIVTARQNTGKIPGAGLLLEGNRRMEAVRETFNTMLKIEAQLLLERQRRADHSRAAFTTILLISSLLGVIILVLAGAVTVREINRSAKARGRIQNVNAMLEKRVEQRTRELTESEERLRLFVEHAPAALSMYDREMRFLVASRRWINDFNLDDNSFLGRSHYEVFPEIPERWKVLHRRCLAGEVLSADEDRFDRADGSVQWLKWEIRPWKDAAGNIGGIVIFSEDITARKQAEEAEREQRTRLDVALASMTDAVFIVDAQGKFLQVNEAFQRYFRFPSPDACPERIAEFGSIFEVYEGETAIIGSVDCWPTMRALRGEVGQDIIYTIHRKDINESWIASYSFSPIRDKDGSIMGAVIVARDITKRKADERELQRLNTELEQRVDQRTAELRDAVKELEAFTYSVSHDLRAPIRHISGFAKMLSEDYREALPAEGQRFIDRIIESAQRMGLLIDDLLNLGRVGRQELRLQTTGLGNIVQEVVADLQSECAGRSVDWRVGPLPFVDCDPGLIRQVVHNLLSNALKFTRPRTPAVIEVGQFSGENGNTIFVRDNGVGFSMKYADKLFGVFQRLHRQEDFEGTGVGLATVQRIIQKHGGRIWAEAELDKGAAFYFTLDSLQDSVKSEQREKESYARRTE